MHSDKKIKRSLKNLFKVQMDISTTEYKWVIDRISDFNLHCQFQGTIKEKCQQLSSTIPTAQHSIIFPSQYKNNNLKIDIWGDMDGLVS